MHISSLLWFLFLGWGGDAKDKVELVEPVRKIWDKGPHNAFTDLLRHEDHWLCVFREGTGHAAGAGKIRILRSPDGKTWTSSGLIEKEGVDLRDPHISITPGGKLMIVGGAAVPPTRDPLTDHFSFVSFSEDGKTWSAPKKVVDSWQWLWRVTWHKGHAYGVAYSSGPPKARVYQGILYNGDGENFK